MQTPRENEKNLEALPDFLSAVFLVCPEDLPTFSQTLKRWTDFFNKRFEKFEIICVVISEKVTQKVELPEKIQAIEGLAMGWEIGPLGECLDKAFLRCRYPLIFYVSSHPGLFLEKQFDLLRKSIDKAHFSGLFRGMRRYPIWIRFFHFCLYLVKRIILSMPWVEIRGPSTLKERFPGWLCNWLFGLNFQDPLLPFRFLRKETLKNIPLQSRGTFCHLEIPIKANFQGLLLAEEVWLEEGREFPRMPKLKDEWFWRDFYLVAGKPKFVRETKESLPLIPEQNNPYQK